VVAAFKGGSPDIPSSASRVDGYVKTLQDKYAVTVYDTIEELCRNVDAVLLESVDGRPISLRRGLSLKRANPCSSTSPWQAHSKMCSRSSACPGG